MRTIAVTTVLALTACSSQYTPQARGRVAVTMRAGAQAYVRDGKVYEHGILGGGLVEAVEGNPAATRAAHEYRDRMTTGLVGVLGGLACSLGGMVYATSQLDSNGDNVDGNAERGLWIALGCTVVMIVGAGYLATAEPYRWDAINIFNDTPPPTLPGAPGYGWSAEKTSLKMRD